MDNEMNCIWKNRTWKLCHALTGANILPEKWIYKVNIGNNEDTRYNARYVIKGFNQEESIDFKETYSPVVNFITLRILFAYATKFDLGIVHLDVETAFLQGDIEEDVYVQQPEGYVDPQHPGMVCKLFKAIYGLKQSGRVWNIKLDTILKELNCNRCEYDQCVYTCFKNNEKLIIAVFVDDLIIFSSSKYIANEITGKLQERLSVRTLGDIKKCFNVNITRDRKRGLLHMDQTDSIVRILQEYGMEDCNPSNIPMDPGSILSAHTSLKSQEELQELRKIPYQNVIRSLMYLLQKTINATRNIIAVIQQASVLNNALSTTRS